MGYSGKGAVVSILDDGIQLDHVDLAANYDAMASSDVNDHDADPTPRDNNDNKCVRRRTRHRAQTRHAMRGRGGGDRG